MTRLLITTWLPNGSAPSTREISPADELARVWRLPGAVSRMTIMRVEKSVEQGKETSR